jgi:hypothetical protein
MTSRTCTTSTPSGRGAATAIAEDLPLFTANQADFSGLDALLRIIPVTRPDVPHEQPRSR